MRKTAGAFLSAILTAGLALMAVGLARPGAARPGAARPGLRPSGSVTKGQWQSSLQHDLEDGMHGKDAALGAWTAIRYLLFREGEPGLVVGRDGWLFSSEELEPVDPTGTLLEAAVDRIVEARDFLAARDIGLVVALVPTKASVYPQHLGRALSPGLRGRYDAVRDALSSRGVEAPDLRTPLAGAAADVFLRTDTHWTAEGAAAAAGALAGAIRPLLDLRDSPRQRFTRTVGEPRERRGDLLAFLPLGPLARIGPRPDTVRPVSTAALDEGDGGAGLFGALEIPVGLVGTSYSAAGDWEFEGALKAALQADVLTVAEQGHGPFAPMQRYLASPALDDPRPLVVVWEMPERYLCVPTPLGIAGAGGGAAADASADAPAGAASD
jgi:alginate O-acetyltransferase complex protein AlgJ